MQGPKSRTRNRIPISCTECRRRKQKCIPTEKGSCLNCLRRYPPVECIGLRQVKGQWIISSLADHPDQRPRLGEAANQPSQPNTPLSTDGNYQPPLYEESLTPRKFGGITTAMTTLHGMPIESTRRISDLMHFFNQYVVPNYVSIDGGQLPPMFLQAILPWMLQSPLMPNIAILMASYSEKMERGLEVSQASETFSIKAHVLGLVNKFLEQDFKLIADEAIRAVTHLVISEWWWGSQQSMWAHMKGIREMVRLQGGMRSFPDSTLRLVLTLTDYELACCYERPLFFDYPSESINLPVPPALMLPIPPWLSAPMFPSPATFAQSARSLDISPQAADILDDIRFLTLSITSPSPTTKTSKIQSTASWLNTRISSPSVLEMKKQQKWIPTQQQLITRIIQQTAQVYTESISTLTPFVSPSSISLTHIAEIKENIVKVTMQQWKLIPGIFLWILMVICPSLGESLEDRKLRKKMAVTGMAVGLEGFDLSIEYLRAHFLVQRWIADQKPMLELVVGRSKE